MQRQDYFVVVQYPDRTANKFQRTLPQQYISQEPQDNNQSRHELRSDEYFVYNITTYKQKPHISYSPLVYKKHRRIRPHQAYVMNLHPQQQLTIRRLYG